MLDRIGSSAISRIGRLLVLLSIVGQATAQEGPSVYQPEPYVRIEHPKWVKDAAIYQINLRQFTAEGTFDAAREQLPRLERLGVKILWLMPIHPIGERERKGELGSPYAVRDYLGVNPEFGDLDAFKAFVAAAHELDIRVIIDWVANHTAWDNVLVEQHPEWYLRNWQGEFRPTHWWDWSDIIELDYGNPELRQYMAEAMAYWVKETDIDGFRCDVAGFVPTDFWEQVRRDLDAIKPVFMLAEWESRDLHARAFNMSYAWSWYDAVHKIAMGKAGLDSLFVYYSWNEKAYPRDALRMTFVSNHDKNSWDGTQFEQFGDALEAAIVLSVVGEGLPLIYNGQEAGNPKRLKFFDRDPIEWRPHPIGDLYARLLALKKSNSALWNGRWGARMVPLENSAPGSVLSFARQDAQHRVLVLINFSAEPARVELPESLAHGEFADFSTGNKVTVSAESAQELPAWGYRVLLGAPLKRPPG